MNSIFFKLIGMYVFVFIDDLVIFSNSLKRYINYLEEAFAILKENGLKVNFEKYHCFKKEVKLLGHTLSVKGISPIDSKVRLLLIDYLQLILNNYVPF